MRTGAFRLVQRRAAPAYFPHRSKASAGKPKGQAHRYLGWHRQSSGLWFVGLPLLCGRLEGTVQKPGLCGALVETYQLDVCAHPALSQDLLLCKHSAPPSAPPAGGPDLPWALPPPEAPVLLARHMPWPRPSAAHLRAGHHEAEADPAAVLDASSTVLQRAGDRATAAVAHDRLPQNGWLHAPYMAESRSGGQLGWKQYQLWLAGTRTSPAWPPPTWSGCRCRRSECTLWSPCCANGKSTQTGGRPRQLWWTSSGKLVLKRCGTLLPHQLDDPAPAVESCRSKDCVEKVYCSV